MNADQPDANRIYYESDEGVRWFEIRYRTGKERIYSRLLVNEIATVPPPLRVLELGGPGYYASFIAPLVKGEYAHSDYSAKMVEAARLRGLKSRQIDALNIDIPPGDYSVILAIELSTVCSPNLETRKRQFVEFARVIT